MSLNAVAPAFPQTFSFQGYLVDGSFVADGEYDFVFRLMEQAVGGSEVWSEAQANVTVADGIFNVELGSGNPFGSLDFNDELWLAVEVDGESEILPRTRIVGVPYALLSNESLDLRLPATISGPGIDDASLLTVEALGPDGEFGTTLKVLGHGSTLYAIQTDASAHGVQVNTSGQAFTASSSEVAFRAVSPTSAGLYVSNPGGDGVNVSNAGSNGIIVTNAGQYAFYFSDIPTTNNGNNMNAYVGVVENTSTGAGSDVLALQTETPGNPNTDANLIGFFDGDNQLIGQIEGNGSGGVAYNTAGSDFAEYLPYASPGEELLAGDVVGVFEGRVTRRTHDADQVMVITDQAAVLGNAPGTDVAVGFEPVSFIGQVRIRVRGPVQTGDYLVASGQDDGTAVAMHPTELAIDDIFRIIGQAWESSNDAGVKRVNAAVGLDRTETLAHIVDRQSKLVSAQQAQIHELRERIEEVLGLLARLNAGS